MGLARLVCCIFLNSLLCQVLQKPNVTQVIWIFTFQSSVSLSPHWLGAELQMEKVVNFTTLLRSPCDSETRCKCKYWPPLPTPNHPPHSDPSLQGLNTTPPFRVGRNYFCCCCRIQNKYANFKIIPGKKIEESIYSICLSLSTTEEHTTSPALYCKTKATTELKQFFFFF